MDTLLQFIIYWDIAMWALGASVTTGALAWAAMALYHKLFRGWGKKVSGDFRFHLWLYQAIRAWERQGNQRPGGPTMTERQKLETCARELIAFAEEHGYVLTITTEPQPLQPLAMGNSFMVFEVRESRERYQKGSKE